VGAAAPVRTSLASALQTVHAHPRHAVLFATTAGLLLGPLSTPATILTALVAAATVSVAAVAGGMTATAEPARTVNAPSDVGGPTATVEPARTVSAGSGPTASDRGLDGGRDDAAARGLVVAVVAAGAVLAGAVVAELRIGALEDWRLPAFRGRPVEARAVVLEPFRERAAGPATARARIVGDAAVRWSGGDVAVRRSGGGAGVRRSGAGAGEVVGTAGEVVVLRVPGAAHPGAWPGVGETVAVVGTVAPLGRFDGYQRRRGAGAAIDVARMQATGARRGGPAGVVDAARRRAEAGLTEDLPPPRAALLRGMVLGQDERLSDATRDDFERSGLAHLLAVSGQNVMLLATLVLAAGAAVGIGLRARLLVALALVAVYVPLTGAGPSIQRAGVMGAAGLVAALAGRAAHRWYALALAAAVTLGLNPRAAGEPGWQLSFAAVVALLALAPGLRGLLARWTPGPVADVAAITVAATCGTAPLMAFHFGEVSLAALPANLVAAAAIAPIMWLGMLAAAAAQISPALAAPFNALAAPLLAFVERVAAVAADAPFAVLPVGVGSPSALALCYVALAAALVGARMAWRRAAHRAGDLHRGRDIAGQVSGGRGLGAGRPGALRSPVVAASIAAAVAIALLASASPTGGTAPPAPGEVVVSFLDVGQGDATLLQRDGVAVLVDTGPPDGPIVQRLAEAGVKRLDALVITHAQADHEGAALAVMRAYPPRLVVNGGAGWPTGVQRALPAAIAAAGAERVDAHAGQTLAFGAIRMRVLWPPPPGPDFHPEGDPNDRALVAHLESGAFDLLLPADAESNVTAVLDLPDVEALKVAHHGSDDEGLPALLDRLDPELAAIEVGRDNSYGHPTPSTLSALRAVPQVFRTDRDGTVRLHVRGGEMHAESSR
jgi:competence protein ComEC